MRVLVALDGTTIGESALGAISPWARDTKAEIVLFTVCRPGTVHETVEQRGFSYGLVPRGTPSGQTLPGVDEPQGVTREDRTQALERLRVDTEEWLHDLSQRYLGGACHAVDVHWSDDVVGSIAAAAETHNADFIAMGTHGRRGLSHALMGSVAEGVLRRSAVPVLMVREGMRVPLT